MTVSQSGIEIREAHFPGRVPIDAYGNGGFRFAEMSHKGSLMCLPSGVYAWDVLIPEDLTEKVFEKLFAEANNIEILLVGTGLNLVPLQDGLRSKLRELQVSADPMATGAAVRTYNVLISEGRAVAAAFLAVE